MESWPTYAVTTRNISINSENKIHDDREAKRFGFKGGLVPGTAVYAHMTRPLVAAYGENWLARHSGALALLKPAYEGERLEVSVHTSGTAADSAALKVSVGNAEGAVLATLETSIPERLPAADPLCRMAPGPADGPRVPIGWDAVTVGQPLRALRWEPTRGEQEAWCSGVSDDLAVYRGARAPVHPGLVLQAANRVLGNHYLLEPWIHVSSRIVSRGPLRVGQGAEVRAVPLERWEKKGHQYFKVYVAIMAGDDPLVEIWHTAIFKVRQAA